MQIKIINRIPILMHLIEKKIRPTNYIIYHYSLNFNLIQYQILQIQI